MRSIETVTEEVFGGGSLNGKRILVQGAKDVGGPLIALPREAGAHVLVGDVGDANVRRMQSEFGAKRMPIGAYRAPTIGSASVASAAHSSGSLALLGVDAWACCRSRTFRTKTEPRNRKIVASPKTAR